MGEHKVNVAYLHIHVQILQEVDQSLKSYLRSENTDMESDLRVSMSDIAPAISAIVLKNVPEKVMATSSLLHFFPTPAQ